MTAEMAVFLWVLIMRWIRDLFKRLLSINITKSGAYATIDTLEYKLVYDVIKDKRNNEEGWVSITQSNDFQDVEIEDFYALEDNEKAFMEAV